VIRKPDVLMADELQMYERLKTFLILLCDDYERRGRKTVELEMINNIVALMNRVESDAR